MTALAKSRATVQEAPSAIVPRGLNFPMAASVKIYEGAIVVLDSSGNAKPGVTGANLTCVGRACSTVDNSSGAAGATRVDVEQGVYWYGNNGDIDATDIGGLCYIVDDQTVSEANAGQSIAGTIYGYDATKGVAVHMQLSAPVDATALQAAIDAETDYEADIASNAHLEGASLVGIEDSAGKITATNVETALAEIAADGWVAGAHIGTNAVTEAKLSLTVAGITQLLSGVGAVDITHRTTRLTSTGAGQAITLIDSTVAGQRKTICHDVDGGSMVLTPTTPFHFATITFTNVHDFAELEWTASGWIIVAYGGVTIA